MLGRAMCFQDWRYCDTQLQVTFYFALDTCPHFGHVVNVKSGRNYGFVFYAHGAHANIPCLVNGLLDSKYAAGWDFASK
jgi:hypothetical protein